MVKRSASVALWFIAVGWGLNYLTLFLGIPEVMGLMVAAIVAAFVGADPIHVLWPEQAATTESRPVHANATRVPIRTNA